jgi:phosphoglycolate phosphatase
MTHPPSLLFDLDGCLVDSFPSILRCWERTLARWGRPAPAADELRPFVGPPVDVVARHLAADADEPTIAAIVADYRRCSARAAGEVSAYDGVPALLAALTDRGITLGVATSKSIEVAEPVLESLGLRRAFAFVEGTPVDELGTDKATVVARALQRLAPQRPVGLVGDRSHDITGAHAHGIRGYGALWGYGSRDELVAAGADALLAAPADVAALV